MSCESKGFLTAVDARSSSRDYQTIFSEICTIEHAILDSVDSKLFSALVDHNSASIMTTDEAYYNSYNKISVSREIDDQIQYVSSYFTSLGYTFRIQTDPSTTNTLQWYISW